MRRSALLLLSLHFAAGSALAQTPPSFNPAPFAGSSALEVRMGDRVTTFSGTTPLPAAPPALTAPPPAMTPPPTSAPVSETLVNFDPHHAEVAWSQNHWQLVADGQVLKDFGSHKTEAWVALRLVRDLHLTQHGFVGTPHPVMEYWLSNGRAPHGMTSGTHLLPLDSQQLRVEQTQGQWTVRDAGRVLFTFGTHESEARAALAIIHKYGFTQIGVIGEAGPSMHVMLGHGDGEYSDPNMPHLERRSPLHDASSASNSPNSPNSPNSLSDPHTPKPPAIKPVSFDNAPAVAPVIPPPRSGPESPKTATNAFGRSETIEVLPINDTMPKLHRTPPPPVALEWIDRTPFDWRQVRLRQEAGHYVIAAGNLILGRFNGDHDARVALAALQHYRFTEINYVGRPQPFCTYFLCEGEPPLGQYLGVHVEPFQPEKLTVSQIENRWAIVSTDNKPLVWFGTRPEEAQAMLQVIQRHQFDRLCRIGDDRGLTFFVRSR